MLKKLKITPLKKINLYLALLSLINTLINIQYSHNFLTAISLDSLVLANLLVSFLIFKYISNNFQLLKTTKGKTIAIFFMLGMLLYSIVSAMSFIGQLAANLSIIIFETQKPHKNVTNRDTYLMFASSLIYCLGLFAYAAFDKTPLGMISLIAAVISINLLLFTSRKPMHTLLFTSYCAFAYTIAMIAAIVFKYH